MVYAFGIEIPLIEILFALGIIGAIVLLEVIIILAISAYQMKNVRELVEEMITGTPSERKEEIKKHLEEHFGKKETRFYEASSEIGEKMSGFFYNAYTKIKRLFHFHWLRNLFKKKQDKIQFKFDKKD